MKKTKPIIGYIKLAGKMVKASLIRRNNTGTRLVRLEENWGVYRLGDKVIVGTGEFTATTG